MNTIYMTQAMWEGHGAENQLGRAVGETRQPAPMCRPGIAVNTVGEDKVIDLAAWKAENLVELEERDERLSGLAQYEGRELVRRPRRRHNSALVKGELAATLSVVGVMLAMIVRVLAF